MTFKYHHTCEICGRDNFSTIFINKETSESDSKEYRIATNQIEKPHQLLKCTNCGLVFSDDVSTKSCFEKAYIEMQDDEYLMEEASRRKTCRMVLKRIEKLKRRGKLLEIGCANGLFLDEAKKSGWETYGIEPSKWAANHAKQTLGLNVTQGTIEDAQYPERTFDAVVMLDVIEHLNSPKSALEKARSLLKNDGILYLSTPDISSVTSKLLKSKWWGINKYHYFCFSRKTLTDLLNVCNFKSQQTFTHARFFSMGYLLSRLHLPNTLARHFSAMLNKARLSNTKIPVNLFDQADIIAKKTISIDDVNISEKRTALKDMKTFVVMPAYNAEKTLEITVSDIPYDLVDKVILVDDCSTDNTVKKAKSLGIDVTQHEKNTGYGGNQKTCYQTALEQGADIVVMVHPDYQYDPTAIPALIEPIKAGRADAVFGSRMMKGGALKGGMPLWKHNANILLTAFENVVLKTYLTEYHSGFRAYSAELLRNIDFEANSDGFVFDTEIIVQTLLKGFKIEEIPIKTRYFDEASQIKFLPCVNYGFGILWTLFKYKLHKSGLIKFKQFK